MRIIRRRIRGGVVWIGGMLMMIYNSGRGGLVVRQLGAKLWLSRILLSNRRSSFIVRLGFRVRGERRAHICLLSWLLALLAHLLRKDLRELIWDFKVKPEHIFLLCRLRSHSLHRLHHLLLGCSARRCILVWSLLLVALQVIGFNCKVRRSFGSCVLRNALQAQLLQCLNCLLLNSRIDIGLIVLIVAVLAWEHCLLLRSGAPLSRLPNLGTLFGRATLSRAASPRLRATLASNSPFLGSSSDFRLASVRRRCVAFNVHSFQ